uniref:GATA-type domain-containing protein n=1 Tax=Rhodosorus marinus TaxID=101924 RepID=A0A7S3A900_9RHOD|mmetsp:Transcript_7758/g.34503  ORF Transcript_7758/g.34503 Transcript_7758/m.34503 type:complete len:371 (+) Transcript_7758:447-1559(+)
MRKTPPQVDRICKQCSAVETPLWRAGPAGPKTLCNACGVRWKKGKLVLNHDADGVRLPTVEGDKAAPVSRSPISKAKSPAGGYKKRGGGRQSQQNVVKQLPLTTATTDDSKAGLEKPKDAPPTAARTGFWTSPASSPISKPDSPVQDRDDDSTKTDEHDMDATMELENAMDPFKLDDVDNAIERCGSDLFDEIEELKQKASTPPVDLLRTIPISPATSSVCPDSPPAHILTTSLLMENTPESLRTLRGAVYDPTKNISRSYKQCVMHLGQLCMNISAEDPKAYVRAFAMDSSLGLNPCGLSFAESERHHLVLQGFFRNEKAYANALSSFRATYSNPELLEYNTGAFVEMLVEDVARVLPALEGRTIKQVA